MTTNKKSLHKKLWAAAEQLRANSSLKLTEMNADHAAAWSKGGTTAAKNCQMLCKTHNCAKGNR